MSRAVDWHSGWIAARRRIGLGLMARAATAGALGFLAVAEMAARFRPGVGLLGSHNGAFIFLLGLLALATTLPLVAEPALPAALVIWPAGVLSLAPFHSLTVAGACAQVVVLYRLSRSGPHLVAGGMALPYLVIALTLPSEPESRALATMLAVVTPAAVWLGYAIRSRRDTASLLATRQAFDETLLEHTARGERARIARELHDVVAHHISLIAVQAETARVTTPRLPEAGAQRFAAIGDTAREALTEMRRLLGVLRDDTGEAAAPRHPQPGLPELNALLDEAREVSGGGTRLILRGRAIALDPGVELAVHRIVQEALTNARRHAPGAAVDVELQYLDAALRVRVRDNGPGPPASMPEGGHGLLGMRERAGAVGGVVHTGPGPGGGFLVEATLPGKVGE